jgi:hypothetical protein
MTGLAVSEIQTLGSLEEATQRLNEAEHFLQDYGSDEELEALNNIKEDILSLSDSIHIRGASKGKQTNHEAINFDALLDNNHSHLLERIETISRLSKDSRWSDISVDVRGHPAKAFKDFIQPLITLSLREKQKTSLLKKLTGLGVQLVDQDLMPESYLNDFLVELEQNKK